MTELNVAEQVIYKLLSTNEALNGLVSDRIFPYIAPTDAAFPYIVFNLQGAAKDVKESGSNRLMSNMLYQAQAVGENTIFEDIDAISSAIDSALDKQSGSCIGGTVFSISREVPVSYPEVSNGKIYLHRGGLYRVIAQSND